nr:MAG TPA: Lactose operon repressor [Caudoviricetes sp.]DAY55982.1 MAG TPA: Lactose operon repressor [Caudoviricetes sp.]
MENIAEKLRVSKSTVSAYLPYTKGVYLGENPSSNALKIRKCRAKNG